MRFFRKIQILNFEIVDFSARTGDIFADDLIAAEQQILKKNCKNRFCCFCLMNCLIGNIKTVYFIDLHC